MLTEFIVVITVYTHIKSCCIAKTNYIICPLYLNFLKKNPIPYTSHFCSPSADLILKKKNYRKGEKRNIFFRIVCPNCETHWVSSLLVWLHANELTVNLLSPLVGNSKCRPHTFDYLVSKPKAVLLTLSQTRPMSALLWKYQPWARKSPRSKALQRELLIDCCYHFQWAFENILQTPWQWA